MNPIQTDEQLSAAEDALRAAKRELNSNESGRTAAAVKLAGLRREARALEAEAAGVVAGTLTALEAATGKSCGERIQRAEDFGADAAIFALGSMMGKAAVFSQVLAARGKPSAA